MINIRLFGNTMMSCPVCKRSHRVRYLNQTIRCVCGRDLFLGAGFEGYWLQRAQSDKKPQFSYKLSDQKTVNIVQVDQGREIEVVLNDMKIYFTTQNFSDAELSITEEFIAAFGGILSFYDKIIEEL